VGAEHSGGQGALSEPALNLTQKIKERSIENRANEPEAFRKITFISAKVTVSGRKGATEKQRRRVDKKGRDSPACQGGEKPGKFSTRKHKKALSQP